MEEERIKSAFEIAMERISALPELTPEEIAAQRERQYGPVGEALAGKYLIGFLNEEELCVEVQRYPADQKQIIRRTLVLALCAALQLEGDLAAAGKALNGLSAIAPESVPLIEEAAEEYRAIIRECDQERQAQSASIEASALRTLGISGTAVRCNPSENPHWLEEMKKIRRQFDPKLKALRDRLEQIVQAG